MEDNVNQFGMTLAQKALERDWEGVRSLLAPWMQLSADQVREFFEAEYRETMKANGVEGMHYPVVPSVDGNSSNLASLRETKDWMNAPRAIAPEVTDENFRQWMNLQLKCSDEQMDELGFDYFSDMWLIVCETPEGLRVGYWSNNAY